MSHPQNDHFNETINDYTPETSHQSKAMQAAERLPQHERKFNEIGEFSTLIGDLANAFAGKGIDYQREFTANTRTALSETLGVDELNFQLGQPINQ
jgi:hypothetical protein